MKQDFDHFFKKGFTFPKNKESQKFHISGDIIELEENYFTIKFIITNISTTPYTIDNFKIYFGTEASEKIYDKYNKPLIMVYLRQNESSIFIEKYKRQANQNEIKNLKIELDILGHDSIFETISK